MQQRRIFALVSLLLVLTLVTFSCAAPAAPGQAQPAAPPTRAFVMDIPPRADGEMAAADQQVLKWDLPGDFWPDPIGIGGWWSESQVLTSAGLTTETIDGKIPGELAEKW